jgi:hypothetical protein
VVPSGVSPEGGTKHDGLYPTPPLGAAAAGYTMLGHEIFDPETNRRVLVDHAFIMSGGEITKAARNWLGGKLDQTNAARSSSWTATMS